MEIEGYSKEGVKGMGSMRVMHSIPGYSIPGRVRFRLSPESPEPNLDDFLIDGVEKVAFNSVTKSLLIIYDARMLLEDLLSGIEEKMPEMTVVKEEQETAEEAEEQEIAEEAEEQEAAEEAEEQEAAEETEEESWGGRLRESSYRWLDQRGWLKRS